MFQRKIYFMPSDGGGGASGGDGPGGGSESESEGGEGTSPSIGGFKQEEREIEVEQGLRGYSQDDGFFSTTTTAWDAATGVATTVDTTTAFGGALESETTNEFDMTMDDPDSGFGQNTLSDTTLSVFGQEAFTYDTHYDSQNIEASFFTEQIADLVDLVAQKQNTLTPDTIGTMSLVEDVAKLAVAGIPTQSFAMLGSTNLGFKALGALSLYSKFDTVSAIAERLGGSATSGNRAIGAGFDKGGDIVRSVTDRISAVNKSNTPTSQPLTAPLLSPITRYASLASIVGDSKRQDFSHQTMNSFRVDYGTNIMKTQKFTVGGINEFKIKV